MWSLWARKKVTTNYDNEEMTTLNSDSKKLVTNEKQCQENFLIILIVFNFVTSNALYWVSIESTKFHNKYN